MLVKAVNHQNHSNRSSIFNDYILRKKNDHYLVKDLVHFFCAHFFLLNRSCTCHSLRVCSQPVKTALRAIAQVHECKRPLQCVRKYVLVNIYLYMCKCLGKHTGKLYNTVISFCCSISICALLRCTLLPLYLFLFR